MECSTAWDGLPAWGTATQASFFVALEQPGPWGRDALTESRLDPALGARLQAEATGAGGRMLLIRAPGHHAAGDGFHSRRVLVAGGLASEPWLLDGVALAPQDVAALPWADVAAGDSRAVLAACPWLRPASRPVLLVCTNARRDLCCALRGRPIALDTAGRHPGQVWECSHTGGHRFAPTGIVLPLGQVLGRLTPGLADAVLAAAASGRLAADALGARHDRGRSHLPPAWAAAESWVRAALGETDPGSLHVGDVAGGVGVRHRDGRAWAVTVSEETGADLPESCGKPARPSRTWRVEPLHG